MDSRYAYLGIIAAALAAVGLVSKYYMPLKEPYGSSFIAAALLIIGFVLFGYGFNAWKWPVWLGSILVMVAFILVASIAVLWFVLAIGLGTISYALQRQRKVAQ